MTLSELMDVDAEPSPSEGRRRKRQLELEEDEEGDNFDLEGIRPTLRCRKRGRRVSGVFREIKSLHNIGHNSEVLELVFDRMTSKENIEAGVTCPMWLIIAYRILRKRLPNTAFLRLWDCPHPSKHLWMDWELHFHEELLGKEEENIPLENQLPITQAIISVGNRQSFGQFVDDEAKLPFRQDYIFAICQNAVVTAPNYSFTDTISNHFEQKGMVIESLFIPKSEHFTVKGFGLNSNKDEWTADEVAGKVKLYEEDLGDNQTLSALLLIKYMDSPAIDSFLEIFNTQYNQAEVLSGDAEEVGTNRLPVTESPEAVGLAIYSGSGATIAVYSVDLHKENVDSVFEMMQRQTRSGRNSFGFMFTHDSQRISLKTDSEDEDGWTSYTSVESCPKVESFLEKIHTWLPTTSIVGVNSLKPILVKGNQANSNIDEMSTADLTFGFLLVTF